jgi:hypothetical protein
VSSSPSPDPSLERELLRKALFALGAGQSRCVDCHRTPLTGERVHVYEDGRLVCELCRPRRREEPIRCERVHGPERGHAVRPAIRAA